MKSSKLDATRKPAGSSRHASRRSSSNHKLPSTRRSDGRSVLVAGASGSGKTSWCVRQIPAGARVLVWDATGEWSGALRLESVRELRTLSELIAGDIRGEYGSFRVAYVGPVTPEHFEAFCRMAWAWLRAGRGRHLVVEELADVTSPGKAPPAWGEICRKGRFRGAFVWAITQRPAESDKTILGNCAQIHCGRLNTPNDRKYMAGVLDVSLEDVTALRDLEYIDRDMRGHTIQRGVIHFSR